MGEALAIYEAMEPFVMAESLNLAIASPSELHGDFELMAGGTKLSLDPAIELARSRETSIGLNPYTERES